MLDLEDVTLRVAGRPLLEGASLHVPASTRLALVGRNGRRQVDFSAPDRRGAAARPRRDPHADGIRIGMVRQEAPGGELSPGGEKTRLALALMCLDAPQLLILDEPTNHLDIDSREALVEAVNDFPGVVIVISHDRHLVELVADSLWLVADGRVRPYDGDMDDYRRLLLETSAEPTAPEPTKPDRRPAGERRALLAPLRRRVKEAERLIERLDQERAGLEARLADPASYANGTDIAALQKRLAELKAQTEEAEHRWLEAGAEIERVAG
jgi:ATP-binding cassette subfamily F protein 3